MQPTLQEEEINKKYNEWFIANLDKEEKEIKRSFEAMEKIKGGKKIFWR